MRKEPPSLSAETILLSDVSKFGNDESESGTFALFIQSYFNKELVHVAAILER
jgi:hypothetical protein